MTTMTEDEILADLANDPHDFSHARVIANYNGPKINACVTGCGAWLASLISAPGSSKVVDEIQILYSEKSMFRFLKANLNHSAYVEAEMAPAVSPARVKAMLASLSKHASRLHVSDEVAMGRSVNLVAVTGAITSARYRRGDNRAWIGVLKVDAEAEEIWQLRLDKLDEHEHTAPNVYRNRLAQDRMISEVALSLVTGIPSKLAEELAVGGYLARS